MTDVNFPTHHNSAQFQRNSALKMRGLVDQDKSRLRGESKEKVHHLQAGCEKLAESEYVRRHDNALKYWRCNGRLIMDC